MGSGTAGENIDVQRTVRQMIGQFQLRRHPQAAALPVVVHDSQNLFLRGCGRCCQKRSWLSWRSLRRTGGRRLPLRSIRSRQRREHGLHELFARPGGCRVAAIVVERHLGRFDLREDCPFFTRSCTRSRMMTSCLGPRQRRLRRRHDRVQERYRSRLPACREGPPDRGLIQRRDLPGDAAAGAHVNLRVGQR